MAVHRCKTIVRNKIFDLLTKGGDGKNVFKLTSEMISKHENNSSNF